MPGGKGKHDLNSGCGPVGSDLVGSLSAGGARSGAAAYAAANRTERARIWSEHRDYVQGLLWYLGHDAAVPPYYREPALAWGLCADEFTRTGGWPEQLYVREARRMQGGVVMTQHDMVQTDAGTDAIGIGGYVVDTHTARRYACVPTPDGGGRNTLGNSSSRSDRSSTINTAGGTSTSTRTSSANSNKVGDYRDQAAHCTGIPAKYMPGPRPVARGYVWNEGHMVSDPGTRSD